MTVTDDPVPTRLGTIFHVDEPTVTLQGKVSFQPTGVTTKSCITSQMLLPTQRRKLQRWAAQRSWMERERASTSES